MTQGVSTVKHVVAIASGKGGVGKSTVSVNLAVAAAQLGLKVGCSTRIFMVRVKPAYLA